MGRIDREWSRPRTVTLSGVSWSSSPNRHQSAFRLRQDVRTRRRNGEAGHRVFGPSPRSDSAGPTDPGGLLLPIALAVWRVTPIRSAGYCCVISLRPTRRARIVVPPRRPERASLTAPGGGSTIASRFRPTAPAPGIRARVRANEIALGQRPCSEGEKGPGRRHVSPAAGALRPDHSVALVRLATAVPDRNPGVPQDLYERDEQRDRDCERPDLARHRVPGRVRRRRRTEHLGDGAPDRPEESDEHDPRVVSQFGVSVFPPQRVTNQTETLPTRGLFLEPRRPSHPAPKPVGRHRHSVEHFRHDTAQEARPVASRMFDEIASRRGVLGGGPGSSAAAGSARGGGAVSRHFEPRGSSASHFTAAIPR